MFITNILQVSALAMVLKSSKPGPEILKGVEYIQDNTIEESKCILSIQGVNVECKSEDEAKTLYDGLKPINGLPEDFVGILNEINSKERSFESDLKSGAFNVIAFFTDSQEHIRAIGALDVPKNFKIIVSTDRDEAARLGIQFPGIVGYNASDKNTLRLEFVPELKTLVSAVGLDSFSKISSENFGEFSTLTQKIIYFISNSASFEEAKAQYGQTAKGFSSLAKIVYFDSEEVKYLVSLSNIKDTDFPVLLIVENDNKRIVKNVAVDGFEASVKSLLDGTADKILFSSILPDDNASRPVKVITTHTYPEVIDDKSVDKIILFSSPRCGICNQLEPVFEACAKTLQNKNVPIFIGKYNTIENEPISGLEIKGVPTIYFGKQDSAELVDISSKRTIADWLTFLSTEGVSSKINIDEFKEYFDQVVPEDAKDEHVHSEACHHDQEEGGDSSEHMRQEL